MSRLVPKQDMFAFFLDDCLEYTQYKSDKSVYIGLASLLKSKIIARGPNENFYFINPMIVFNGDRVTFAKTYVKKQKGKSMIVVFQLEPPHQSPSDQPGSSSQCWLNLFWHLLEHWSGT